MIANKVFNGYVINTVDIAQAYLNAPIDGDVFMYLDSEATRKSMKLCKERGITVTNEFLDEKDRIIVQLDKALYGLQQSATLWNRTLSNAIIGMGYKKCTEDPCIFFNDSGEIMIVYVDDLLLMHKSQERSKDFIKTLSKYFEVEHTSKEASYSYLGMNIEVLEDKISISMKGFIDALLQDYGNVKPTKSPATENLFVNNKNKYEEEVTIME